MSSRSIRLPGFLAALACLAVTASAAPAPQEGGYTRHPSTATMPGAPAGAAALPDQTVDPEIEAAVDRLRQAVTAAPPSPALGRGFESLDMTLLARTPEGYVRTLSAPPGRALPLPRGMRGDAPAGALAFLSRHARAFGVARPDVRLVVQRAKEANGRSVVRLSQEFRALPVFGAAALVQLGGEGVEFVLADLARDGAAFHTPDFDTTPGTTRATASAVALALVQEARTAPDLVVDEPFLAVFEPSVIGEAGPSLLVWQTRVRSELAMVDELVLVDAHAGDVAFHFSQIKEAKSRQIYDANNVSGSLGTLVRSEGQGPSGITDADLAYTYLGDTYDFFFTRFGRDSLNGAGMPLVARVRYCEPSASCPFQNAYWNGSEMRFGQGFSAADDVVAHELSHGVTENESNLIYWGEAGAINEALSDIFGELVDQTNTGGSDGAAYKWKMGEDVPGIGAIRDMSNPPLFGDPDRRNSPQWWTGLSDNRGVHTNSGVANKLAYLLVDGGTFNGYTVAAQGLTKTAALFYEAEANLLVTGSDYVDLYHVLRQAAKTLGWSPDSRAALERACRAVEIAVPAALTTVASDDFEGTMAKWTVTGGGTAPNTRWGLSTYRKSTGTKSAWCAGGGPSPSPAGGNYVNGQDTWMRYGPFSLAGATRAWFEFDMRLYSEPGYDKLGIYVSTNGTNFYGYAFDNSTVGYTSSGFVRELIDMRELERVFSAQGLVLHGQPQVYVAFRFSSDTSVVYEGNYVDNFALMKGGGAPPFGAFETPAHGTAGVTGSVAVTGWALDDDEVTKVEVWRSSVAGEPAGQVYIGDATLVPGARPDVDNAYATYPWSYRAGWGYMMLTNFLPASGNGTFTLHAYARDAGGGSTLLGSKTITCSNASAVKPFGAIDTPGQGQTVSGSSYINWGWALTPMPASIATSGATIQVYIDGAPVGNPTAYGLARSDIDTLFPGYANTGSAVGYRVLNTTGLANGIHTIAWIVTDSQGRSDGIGSRYFWVQN
jgi:hypothetical protein